jgi:choline dehydrogenase
MYPHYLESPRDIDILVDGIKLVIQLANTPALQKYGLTIDTTPTKGCEGYVFGSDQYFVCALRRETEPEHHQGGTTKMGPVEDRMTVVDNHLRVHGMKNIRVVDASIFPTLPNCNPTSVIIMIAEKVSDLIKEAWVMDRSPIALLPRPIAPVSGPTLLNLTTPCDPYIDRHKVRFL